MKFGRHENALLAVIRLKLSGQLAVCYVSPRVLQIAVFRAGGAHQPEVIRLGSFYAVSARLGVTVEVTDFGLQSEW